MIDDINELTAALRDHIVHHSDDLVYFAEDFSAFSSHRDHLEQALLQLQGEELVIQLAEGIYARAKRSTWRPDMLITCGGFDGVVSRVVEKLGRHTIPGHYERLAAQGLSNQVPTGRCRTVDGPPIHLVLKVGNGWVHIISDDTPL